jgi:GTP-binding protein
MFIDTAKVMIRSGDGGDGCLSFHREKFMPRGGPDGGDGGDGGNVVFIGDSNLNTLAAFHYSPKLFAQNGQPGKGRRCAGKKGRTLKVRVPLGTVIRNRDTDDIACEIIEPEKPVVVAHGGKGGRGNAHFATPTNQAPRRIEEGTRGVFFHALLELKLIADVGLVGFPNAGKSSLIATVSHARPKVAGYPFTTLAPNLGVVPLSSFRNLVMADIPGIIEGASEGRGLGIRFLRHIERTKILLFVVDISSYADPPPAQAYRKLRREILEYGRRLESKTYLIAANKIDLDPESVALQAFLEELDEKDREKVVAVSAATRKGVPELLRALDRTLFAESG